MRLDKFLAEKNKHISRSKIQQAIRAGEVLINGQKVLEPDFNVSENDHIKIPEFKKEELIPSNIELKIIFENDDLAVIDKPAGLVVHPGAGNTEDTLSNALLNYFPQIKNVGEPHRPGIVHRLDEDTSGLIVVAKTQVAYEYLKKIFLERTVEKEYLTLVNGVPEKVHGFIDLPLEKVPLKQKMKVGSGKEAVTEYWVLETSSRNPDESQDLKKPDPESSSGLGRGANTSSLQFSLLRVKLHTGRTHQIRAHLSHSKHPIVGDAVYGTKEKLIQRQFLHAYRLKFKLMDGTWIELESPLPDDLKDVLSKLGIKYDKFI